MISETEAQELVDSKNLITIGVKADEVRRRSHGTRTTFVRVFEIDVHRPAATLPSKTSAGEFRIVGSPTSLQAAVEAVRAARVLAGDLPVFGFSLGDVAEIEDAASLPALRDAGLDGIAESPLDALQDSASTIAAAREAGLVVSRLTVNAAREHDRGELA